MEQKQKKSFFDKLKSLLNNQEFKDLINAYEEDLNKLMISNHLKKNYLN